MYKNYQAYTKAASFFCCLFAVVHTVYKYKSLNCSYTDMSANQRPDEGLWPETRYASNIMLAAI